jgi:hypothetical protein
MENLEKFDVLCISNYAADSSMLRRATLSQGDFIDGSFLPPFYYSVGDIKGAIILINSSNKDLMSPKGRKLAKEHFIKALDYATKINPKVVVLLAAGLKRLFGKEIEAEIGNITDISGNVVNIKQTLRDRYPDVLFTNGDNGTSFLLIEEVKKIMEKAGIAKNFGKVGILGAGLLGTDVLNYLLSQNLNDNQINIVSLYSSEVKESIGSRKINVFEDLKDIETNIDLMICCTSNKLLSADMVDVLGVKYVLDVSVPPAFVEDEYFKTKNIHRQDSGNAYNPDLKYYFDPDILDLSPYNMFGCFAEATSLAYNYDEKFFEIDLFTVNDKTKKIVSVLFEKANFSTHPRPLCFGREV